MTDITVLHRQSRARIGRLDGIDAAREHVATCSDLPQLVAEWWGEIDTAELHAHEVQMVVGAILQPPEDVARYAHEFRRRAFLDSGECETLIEDMAAGAKEWPR